MKKTLSLLSLSLVAVLAFTACSNNTTEVVSEVPSEVSSETSSVDQVQTVVEPFDKDIKNNSLAISSDEKVAVVSYSELNTVIVYDLENKVVKKQIDTFITPRNIAFSSDGSSFYVSDSSHGAIFEYSTQTLEETRKFQLNQGVFGFAIDHADNKIFANNQATNSVSVIDISNGNIDKEIQGFEQPRQGIVMGPDGNKVYVTNFKGDDVRVIDKATLEIDKTLSGIPSVRAISIHKDSKYLYGASSSDGTINVVDIATGELYKTIKVGEEPYGAALSKDGKTILVGNKASNDVSVISVEDDYKVLRTIKGFDEPRQAIVYSASTENKAYVLNKDLSVSVVDYSKGEILETIK